MVCFSACLLTFSNFFGAFVQNAEVTRQMTVARAAQDEVDEVRKEMQEKVKAAQDAAERQVRMTFMFCNRAKQLSGCCFPAHRSSRFLTDLLTSLVQESEQMEQLGELQKALGSTRAELDSLRTTMASSQQVTIPSTVSRSKH